MIMKNKTNVNVADAVNYIEQLCESQSTGTIFMMTKTGVIAQIKVAKGDMVDIHYLTERGMKALAHIFESTKFSKVTFLPRGTPTLKRKSDPELPSQQIIWEYIRGIEGNIAPKNEPRVKGVESIKAEVIEDAHKEKKINIAQVINIVSPEVTIHLGPMGAIICKRYFGNAKNQSEVLSALDKIANEIGDVVEREKFKRQMKRKLQYLL